MFQLEFAESHRVYSIGCSAIPSEEQGRRLGYQDGFVLTPESKPFGSLLAGSLEDGNNFSF